MVDVGGQLIGPFGGPLKDRIWDKMLINKWLKVPGSKYDTANKVWLRNKAIWFVKLVEIISLKKGEARGLGMKTVTGIKRSVCFAEVVPVLRAAELLVVSTTWKGNEDTHTATNGYGRHTEDSEVYRDGQGRSWSGLGCRSYCGSVGAALSQEGAVRLCEIVTPARNTAGKSTGALKPWQGQEARGAEAVTTAA